MINYDCCQAVPETLRNFVMGWSRKQFDDKKEQLVPLVRTERDHVHAVMEYAEVQFKLVIPTVGDQAEAYLHLMGKHDAVSEQLTEQVSRGQLTFDEAERIQAELRCFWDDLRQTVAEAGWELVFVKASQAVHTTRALWKLVFPIDNLQLRTIARCLLAAKKMQEAHRDYRCYGL